MYTEVMNANDFGSRLVRLVDEKFPGRGGRRRASTAFGVSESQLSKYVSGENMPESPKLIRMAQTLGIPLSVLVGHDIASPSTIVPLLGVVSAGDGGGEEYPPGTLLTVSGLWPENAVAYRVSGVSMEDELIGDGDYILIRPQPSAASGEKVVVWVPDMGTMVKLKRKKHYASANARQSREPIPAEEGCREYGVLVGVIRKC